MIDEGLCVQCLHVGSYDDEPATVEAMDAYAREQGYVLDVTDERRHHEIYLSDARKVAPEKLKTVIRHPIKPLADSWGTGNRRRGAILRGWTWWRSPGDAGNVGPITT